MAVEPPTAKTETRAQVIFAEKLQAQYKQADRFFCALLLFEWLAGIAVALWISPRTWAGTYSALHIHVLSAIFLGGLIALPPVVLGLSLPGAGLTRYTISIAQALMSALLIHLTGGRIETHFHVFVSLAFLSFYRDWKVLIPATIVTAVDHLFRGIYFPYSVYGSLAIEPWRWLEHALWVFFEDSILIVMCRAATHEMLQAARKMAILEELNEDIEQLVERRTQQLDEERAWATMQYEMMQSLSETRTWHDSIAEFLRALTVNFALKHGTTRGEFWSSSTDSHELRCVANCVAERTGQCEFVVPANVRNPHGLDKPFNYASELAPRQFSERGVLLPIWHQEKFFGVFEFVSEEIPNGNLHALNALSKQIGQFFLRKETESECAHLADIVKQSSSAIITVTSDNLISSWNFGAADTFGYRDCEAITSPVDTILEDESRGLAEFLESSARQGKRIDNHEVAIFDRTGKAVDLLLSAVPRLDESGQYAGYSLTCHNITHRKAAERRVSEFHSVVSHELRTPLTSIRGALGLIECGIVENGSSEAIELIGVARTSADRLIRLINDILDLKKIESGNMRLRAEYLDVKALVANCASSLTGVAEEVGVKLEFETNDAMIYADRDRATQILTNLISNAIKFSPKGATVSISASAESKEFVRFSIRDKGPGIAHEDQVRLFEKFQQVDSSDTRAFGGTGLGLSISKALAEQHGGNIGVNSTICAGSEFWFTLPTKPQKTEGGRPKLNELSEVPRELPAEIMS